MPRQLKVPKMNGTRWQKSPVKPVITAATLCPRRKRDWVNRAEGSSLVARVTWGRDGDDGKRFFKRVLELFLIVVM